LIGWPFAPFTAPSQSPVPVGFLPAVKPSWGAKAAICAADGVPEDGVGIGAGAEEGEGVGRGVGEDVGLGEGEGDGDGTVDGGEVVPALIAAA
jgi:hypothetical protein